MHYGAGNLSGFIAVILWSLVPVLVTLCAEVSLFLLLGTACLVSFLMFAAGWVRAGQGVFKRLLVAPGALVVTTAGYGLYRGLAWSALLLVNPVEASVLIYLWPATDVLFPVLLGRRSGKKRRHLVGVLLGIGGVLIVVSDGLDLFGNLSLGHALAIVSVVVWGIYAALADRDERYAGDAVAAAYLVSGVIFLAVAALIEWPWSMGLDDFGFVSMAALAGGAGSYLWGVGREEGDGRSLGLWSLIAPVLAVFWLVMLQNYELGVAAGIGAVLVFAAGVIVSPHFRKKNVMRLGAGGD